MEQWTEELGINAAEVEKIGERDGAERGEDGLGMELKEGRMGRDRAEGGEDGAGMERMEGRIGHVLRDGMEMGHQ